MDIREDMEPNIAAAYFAMDMLSGSDLVRVALHALQSDIVSPSLMILAGELEHIATLDEVAPLFRKSLKELGIKLPDREEALKEVVRDYARQMLSQQMSLKRGILHIGELCYQVQEVPEWLRPLQAAYYYYDDLLDHLRVESISASQKQQEIDKADLKVLVACRNLLESAS